MLWFILALAMIVIPSIALAIDHFRRQGIPPLPKFSSLLNFRKRPAASDGFYRLLAEDIVKGEFRKKPLRKKPFVELFPTQTACPHCGGKRRKSWGVAEAERLVNDVATLARQIKQKRLCLVCLAQLSRISKFVGKRLKEPEKEKPLSFLRKVGLSFLRRVRRIRVPSLARIGARVPSLARLGVVIFAVSAFSALFLHEVRVAGILRLEVVLLLASLALFALGIFWKVLRALFRRFGWPVLVAAISFMAIMLAGLVVR